MKLPAPHIRPLIAQSEKYNWAQAKNHCFLLKWYTLQDMEHGKDKLQEWENAF